MEKRCVEGRIGHGKRRLDRKHLNPCTRADGGAGLQMLAILAQGSRGTLGSPGSLSGCSHSEPRRSNNPS